ncbi:MAG: protein kinase [Deltaproteobacteria bacterium]|nr:protein kinase [Deltaproteobacteria bacterium]
MAIIYLAKTVSVDGFEKPLVIKTIRPDFAKDPLFVKRFTDEAKTVVQLTHGNIVPVFDMGVQSGEYYIAMEYIAGKNIKQMLMRCAEKGEEINPEMVIFILIEVCKGLAYAHRKVDHNDHPLNIVHRDINPQNILISYEGEVKIVDFGIAQAASETGKEHEGILEGKLRYMAPEQAACKQIDKRVDIYAVGCVLFEMLTGRKLFNQDSIDNLYNTVLNPNVTNDVMRSRFIPDALKPLLIKALSPNPDDRYRDVENVQMALTNILYSTRSMINSADLSSFMRFLYKKEIVEEREMLRRAQVVGTLLKEAGNEIEGSPGLFTNMELKVLEDTFSIKPTKDTKRTLRIKAGEEEKQDFPEDLLDYIKYGKAVPKGTVIFEQGDTGNHLFIIKKGTVRIYKKIKGMEATLAVLREGDFFGEMSLLNDEPRSAWAEATDDAQLIVVTKDSFRSMINNNVDIAIKIMQRLASRLRDTDDLIESMMLGDDISKLLHGLLKMAVYRDPQTGGHKCVELPIAQLMEWTGMRNQKIGREYLQNLVEKGVLHIDKGVLTVQDPVKLEKFFLSFEINRI